MKTAMLALIALVTAAPSPPQHTVAYRWANVKVGGGGFAPAIVFSPAPGGPAYLRTDMGGAYRFDRRAGHWVPLMDSLPEGSYFGIESIAPDPSNADRVYVAAGMYRRGPAAILASSDRGRSWRITSVPFRMGGNEDGRGLGERLAVDPHAPDRVWFGSRHDGLWRSDDAGASWRRDTRFPYAGAGEPAERRTNAGVGFVLFDPASRRVFASVADRGLHGLFRSGDGGKHWARVHGGPADLLPVKAAIDAGGTLYVTYADGIGPNGVKRGAVWALNRAGAWRDVTPERGAQVPEGGYIGIAAHPSRPGTLYVSTFNRWRPGDTIWRTRDGGLSWTDLAPLSHRDTRATPFLSWGAQEAEFGHWLAGLALDPHRPERLAYTTGATLYRTDGAAGAALRWTPWTEGVEQTAIITLTSPTGGAHLVSGFGDLGGFVHHDLGRSPPRMHLNPRNTNTNRLDYAGRRPNTLVRSGNVHADQVSEAGLAISRDGGVSWLPLRTRFWGAEALEAHGRAPIAVSADGNSIFVGAEKALVSHDEGRSWVGSAGLQPGLLVVTDKVDAVRAWAIDHQSGRLLASGDGGRSFAPVPAAGLCPDLRVTRPRNRETPSALLASPFAAGDLFLNCGGALYRSRDGGGRFTRIAKGLSIALFGLGRGLRPSEPALYAVATQAGGETWVWRSLDGGNRWQRINDAHHRWGNRFRIISGDPRIFGRVYIGTDGRGILYGDPR
jgi:xyloglucan-specific exo-beta-1,4-glucanase